MNARHYLAEANTFFNKNHYKAAIEMYTRGIEALDKSSPEYLSTLIKRGTAYQLLIETGNISAQFAIDFAEKAIQDYVTAITRDGNLVEAKDKLFATERIIARLYYNQGDYTKTIDLCKKFITDHPSHSNVDNWNCFIANAYFYQELYPTAIKYFNDAINFNPNNSHVYYNLGGVYKKLNNSKDALKNFLQAIELDETLINELKSEKKYIFNTILGLPREEKIKLLNLYVDPNTFLGKFAYASRKNYDCKPNRGTLKKAHAILKNETQQDNTPVSLPNKTKFAKTKDITLGFIKPTKNKSTSKENACELKLLSP